MSDYIKTKLKYLINPQFIEGINKYGGFYIAGGALTSLATNKDINDIDIFFPNREALLEAVLFLKEDSAIYCSFISDKSITFSDGATNFQLIYFDFYEKPEDIFKHFDFTICMAAYSSLTDEIIYHEDFLLHNSQRRLFFNSQTRFPILSSLRVQKYEKRGYSISKNEFLKVLFAVKGCEINSWKDLKNQCGQLYGCNFIKDEDIPDEEFSMEKALEVISKVNFEGSSVKEFKYSPEVIDIVLKGEPIKYFILDGKKKHVQCRYNPLIDDLISNGTIEGREVSLKDFIGPFIYKFVKSDYCSFHDSSFQYKFGEEAIGRGKQGYSLSYKNNPLWFASQDNVCHAKYHSKDGARLIKCSYKEEDFLTFEGNFVIFHKATPIEDATESYERGEFGSNKADDDVIF